MLSDKHIESFRAIYKAHFGEDIGKEAALEKGAKLLRLMQLTYKPMTKAEFDAVQKKRKELIGNDESNSVKKPSAP